MPAKYQPNLPSAVLKDFVGWLKHSRIPGLIIGGVAASILGRPRVTGDIDGLVLIDFEHLGQFVKDGKQFGFVSRISDLISFARKNRVLLMKHKPSGIDADISLGALPFEHETIERTVWIKISNFSLPVPTPEDLIIMKAVAHRQRDLFDIESILHVNSELDLKRIRKWVKEFSSVLEMPEILDDLEKLIKKRNK